MKLWRVVKTSRANEAFTGEGAFRFGGRWNSPGLRAIYCSGSKALALLEVLAHIDPVDAPRRWTSFHFEVNKSQVEVANQPEEWLIESVSRAFGDLWLRSMRGVILAVPSVIVPEESNYLINPLHPDFGSLRSPHRTDFDLDLRFLR